MGLPQEDFLCLEGRKKEENTDGYIEKILKEGNTFGEGESSFGEPSSVRKPESVSKVSSLQLCTYILLYQGHGIWEKYYGWNSQHEHMWKQG